MDSIPTAPTLLTARDVKLFCRAHRLAASRVAEDVECEGVRVRLDDDSTGRWYDTRPMLDARERPPEHVDMATEGIAYGIETGILLRHPTQPHLVCVLFGRV